MPLKNLLTKIRSYFFTGILITAPVVITFWIVISLVNIFDSLVTPLIPQKYNPNTYLPRDIPVAVAIEVGGKPQTVEIIEHNITY